MDLNDKRNINNTFGIDNISGPPKTQELDNILLRFAFGFIQYFSDLNGQIICCNRLHVEPFGFHGFGVLLIVFCR